MDAYQQADYVISKIEDLYNCGTDYDQIAILYRAHYHAMELQVELSRRGLPFLITSGLRFFEQAHVKDLVAQLRFVANPKDSTAFLRFACLLPKVGEKTAINFATCQESLRGKVSAYLRNHGRFYSTQKSTQGCSRGLGIMAETLLQIHEVASHSAPSVVVEEAIGGWYQLYLRATYENWPRREEDLESLVDFASKHESLAEMLSQLVY